VRVFVLGSSSLGNALLFASANSRVLVDGGIGPRVAAERMAAMGEELLPRGLDGIVVTHQHEDHAGKVGPLARATGAPVWLHDGVDIPRVRKKLNVKRYDTTRAFTIGDFTVEAFELPHDAPQVALRLTAKDLTVGLVTDSGYVPRGLDRFLGACDEVLLESNYCPEMLDFSEYPPSVRKRIAGPEGHLSNEDAASLVARLEGTRVVRVHLCHISQNSNTPDRALEVVQRKAKTIAVGVIPAAGGCILEIQERPRPSGAFVQLGLFGT
jgi:phosphoribosyl 1,2-cyclic phosphodiesterase